MKKCFLFFLLTFISINLFAAFNPKIKYANISTDDNLEAVLEDGHFVRLKYKTKKGYEPYEGFYSFYDGWNLLFSGEMRIDSNKNIYIDYPKTTESKQDINVINKWIKKFFPEDDKKNAATLNWNPAYINLERSKSGALFFDNLVFLSDKYSNILSEGDNFKLNGLTLTATKKTTLYVKEETCFYKEPDLQSRKIYIDQNYIQSYQYISERQYLGKKINLVKMEASIPVYPGTYLEIRASYNNPKEKQMWYLVKTDSYTNTDYAWIMEKCTAKDCDFDTLVASLKKAGSITVTEGDISKISNKMKLIDIESEECQFLYYDDSYLYFTDSFSGKYVKLPASHLSVDSDGYLKFKYKDYSLLFIMGGINQLFRNFKNSGGYDDEYSQASYHDYYFESVTASSYYKETIKGKQIKYTPDNLTKAFETGCRCHPYWWNYSHIPWVEGVEGNGIGEYIDVKFKEPIQSIVLLNGYTDINNMKLYKQNSRVKKFILEDLDNKTRQTVNFEDYVYFNSVILDKPTTKIRLTIQDVYPGTKYQDTCFSSILAFPGKLNNNSDKKLEENANNFKELYKYAMEITPEEYFNIK